MRHRSSLSVSKEDNYRGKISSEAESPCPPSRISHPEITIPHLSSSFADKDESNRDSTPSPPPRKFWITSTFNTNTDKHTDQTLSKKRDKGEIT